MSSGWQDYEIEANHKPVNKPTFDSSTFFTVRFGWIGFTFDPCLRLVQFADGTKWAYVGFGLYYRTTVSSTQIAANRFNALLASQRITSLDRKHKHQRVFAFDDFIPLPEETEFNEVNDDAHLFIDFVDRLQNTR